MAASASSAWAISGVIYDAKSYQPIAGIVVNLIDEHTGAPVPQAVLGPGQQGQTTTVQGAYQFDPPAGTYHIQLALAPNTYQFPSAVLPPTGASPATPLGALAVQNASHQVSPTAVPAAGANSVYYLRFSTSGVHGEYQQNNIPLDAFGGLLNLNLKVFRPRLTAGESSAVEFAIQNGAETAVTGSPLINLPSGFLLGPGSLEIRDQKGDLVGKPRATPNSRTISFGPLSIPAGQRYAIRFYAETTLRTAIGSATLTASLTSGAGGNLGGTVSATVTIDADTITQRSEIIGRVFCDDNRNGRFDQGERGIHFARVYIDSGAYAVTDRYGKFHFSDQPPGMHLAKVDPQTVPPGSVSTTGIRHDFHLTEGLPAKIDFGFDCALEHADVVAGDVVQAASQGVTEEVVVTTQPLAVTIGKQVYDFAAVDAVAVVDDGAVDFAANAVEVQPQQKLSFAVAAPATSGHYAIRVYAGADLVRELTGRGPVPERILLPEPLPAGGQYTYDFSTWTGDRFDRSKRRRLTVAAAVSAAAVSAAAVPFAAPSETSETTASETVASEPTVVHGELFDKKDRLTATLASDLAAALTALAANPAATLDLEVHVADDGPSATRQARSQRRAEAIKTFLESRGIAAERLTVRGMGDSQPLAPNFNNKSREQNRRVVWRVIEPRAPAVAAPPVMAASIPTLLAASLPSLAASLTTDSAPPPGPRVVTINGAKRVLSEPLHRTVPRPFSILVEDNDGRALGLTLPVLTPGNTTELTTVNDRLILDGRPVVLPLSDFSCRLPVVDEHRPVRVLLSGNDNATVVADLVNGSGEKVERTAAPGSRDITFPAPGEGTFTLHCAAADSAGDRVTMAPFVFTVAEHSVERVIRGNLFDNGQVGADLKKALTEVIAKLTASGHLDVAVHAAGIPGTTGIEELENTQKEARIVADFLLKNGLTGSRFSVAGLGKEHPLEPPLSKVAMAKNRRVVLRYELPVSQPVVVAVDSPANDASDAAGTPASVEAASSTQMSSAPTVGQASLSINGDPIAEDHGHKIVQRGEAISVDVRDADGRQATYQLNPNAASSQPTSAVEAEQFFRQSSAPVSAGAIAPPESIESKAEAPVLSGVSLVVPPDGTILKTDQLGVLIEGLPGTTLGLGDQVVTVDKYGSAELVVALKEGSNDLTFVVTSPSGERGQLRRHYTMSPNRFFLMAMAEGSIGQAGAQDMLPETGSESTIKIDNGEGFLHGRAVLYLKARIKGDWFFKDNRFTVYADSAGETSSVFARNVIDPDRFYPVYGDSGDEVQDANTNHKLYVLIEADASKLEVGNIFTKLQGLELFRYDRALFGARVDFDRGFSQYDHTKLTAFVGNPLVASQHVHLSLRGTGGSLYFMRDHAIVEGSETIRLVVRDAVNDSVVNEVVKVRNVDYTIDYDTGRVVFLEPISAYSSGSFAGNVTPISVGQGGNPLFVEVDYEAIDGGLNQQVSAGGYVKETVFDKVTVGGGVVQEHTDGSATPDYKLYGGSLEIKPMPGLYVGGEINRSESQDTQLAVSVDGGQSYAAINRSATLTDPNSGAVSPVSGYAMKGTFQLDLQKMLNLDRQVFTMSGYAARIDPNFYAAGGTLEQGQVKFGAAVKAMLTEHDTLLLRHDGSFSDIMDQVNPDQIDRRIDRQLDAVGYEHQADRWGAGFLYYHTFTQDSTINGNVLTDTIDLRGEYRLTKKLTVFGTEEFVPRGDPTVIQTDGDRFATELGFRYKINDQIEAMVAETVRYSGSNATTVGIRTPFGDDGHLYVNERFGQDLGGFSATTIVGGENSIARGSQAFGEYQMTGGVSGTQARAVYGLNNRWPLADGVFFNLLYERSQNASPGAAASGPGALNGNGGLTAGVPTQSQGYVGEGSGLIGSNRAFFAPSAILGLMYPVGIASRDSVASGIELTRWSFLKLTSRLEVRYDRQDQSLGGADRLTVYGSFGGSAQINRDLTLLGRLEIGDARDLGNDTTILRMTQGTIGLAYRPVDFDYFNALMKYTKRQFWQPVDLLSGDIERDSLDVVSIVPVVELPWIRTQIVEKLAYEMDNLQESSLAPTQSTTIMLINRLNFHVLKWLDIGGEYRIKTSNLAAQSASGFLGEVSFLPTEYVRLGAGYNFTHFSDDELADPRIDNRGFFVRAVGRY